ncbi:MAG TPA: hypothetical protein PKL15_06635, partial [Saprospiraceae bacterium]|nr:hypothetical protein [Saprospiraceae bacterium]
MSTRRNNPQNNKNTSKPAAGASAAAQPGFVRRNAVRLLALVVLAAGAFFGYRYYVQKSAPAGPKYVFGAEETLTATQPVLELLSPEQTGVDFQNIITETESNNISTNI